MTERKTDTPVNFFVEEAKRRTGTVVYKVKKIKKTTLDRFLTADRGVKLDQN